jgi:hypothetical protein
MHPDPFSMAPVQIRLAISLDCPGCSGGLRRSDSREFVYCWNSTCPMYRRLFYVPTIPLVPYPVLEPAASERQFSTDPEPPPPPSGHFAAVSAPMPG